MEDNKPSLWIKTTDMPDDQISFYALFIVGPPDGIISHGKAGWYYIEGENGYFGDLKRLYPKSEVSYYQPYPELPKE